MKAEGETSILDPTGNVWNRGEDRPSMIDVGVGDGERIKRKRDDGSGDRGGDTDRELSAALISMYGTSGVSHIRTSCHPC